MNPSIPFVYPGVQVEPSYQILYGRENRERFRLGNQLIANEWKERLRTISWSDYPSIDKKNIQTFLQAELGYILSKHYTIKMLQAISDPLTQNWYVSIEIEELDDFVVLQVTFIQEPRYKIKSVTFLGFTPQDRVAFPSDHVDGRPQARPLTSEYSCYGTNVLHRNTLPGTVVTLDTTTIHTLKDTYHAQFSPELESNWPTLLHPDSSRKKT